MEAQKKRIIREGSAGFALDAIVRVGKHPCCREPSAYRSRCIALDAGQHRFGSDSAHSASSPHVQVLQCWVLTGQRAERSCVTPLVRYDAERPVGSAGQRTKEGEFQRSADVASKSVAHCFSAAAKAVFHARIDDCVQSRRRCLPCLHWWCSGGYRRPFGLGGEGKIKESSRFRSAIVCTLIFGLSRRPGWRLPCQRLVFAAVCTPSAGTALLGETNA
jgi:hypothetical protein